MKNKHLSLLLALMSLATGGHADQNVLEKIFVPKNITEEMPDFVQYRNRVMVFTPAHVGYERMRLNGMYVGIEAYRSLIFNKSKSFVDAELRIGHNYFYNGKDHFTPFLMLGCAGANNNRTFFDVDYRFTDWGIVYGGGGFLYAHEFDSIFSLGINVKFLLGGQFYEKQKKLGSPVAGLDVAVPFTFRFGHLKEWDFRLEPFFFGLYGQTASLGYFGCRNSIGYRF